MASKRRRRRSSAPPKPSQRVRDIESVDMSPTSKLEEKYCDAFKSKPNSPEWYALNPQLMKDYASLPFGNPVGAKPTYGTTTTQANAVPGLMTVNFYPCVGYASAETDPINVAMRRVYSTIRRANSGSTNYDPADLMLFLICVDSAFMYLSWMKRLYGVMRNYTQYNRYLPRALVEAQYVSFESLESNLNDFRGYINQFAIKLDQLWIPNSMSYMARHVWMCEGLYTDSSAYKAQLYMYVPKGFYQFTLAGTPKVGSAHMVDPLTAQSTVSLDFEDIVQFGNSLLGPMITNQDFAIMGGDILKAFGESGVIHASGITEDYQVLPIYSQEVLSQIENATAYGNVSNLDVTQATEVGTGYLVSTPSVANTLFNTTNRTTTPGTTAIMQSYQQNKILNMHKDDVTPDDVMVATRLLNVPESVTITPVSSGGPRVRVSFNCTTAGSEIVDSFQIWYYHYSSTVTTLESVVLRTVMALDLAGLDASSSGNASDDYTFLWYAMGAITSFDWHPEIRLLLGKTAGSGWGAFETYYPMLDFDNYTTVTANNIKNMNMTALLSEFTVPQLG